MDRNYGPLLRARREPAIAVLVRTILSQNTSDVNSGRAFASLRRRFPRWDQVLHATRQKIASAIRSGGLAEIKAGHIRQTLKIIVQREGTISLRRLRMMSNTKALEYLLSLPGVGIKTACCVLLFSFQRAVMPVDTHIYRVAVRTGLIGEKTAIERAHEILEKLLPPNRMLALHLELIEHGRRVCHPRSPDCAQCPILKLCRYGCRH